MNYRHAYHAGNFADVMKHAVLALVIEHMKLKDKPFRLIDTHAGTGIYDLAGTKAEKTGEWRHGIGRLVGPEASPITDGAVAALLDPYLSVVRNLNDESTLRSYPGSPLLARRLMRPGDALVANELHPKDNAALRTLMTRERDTKVLALDGWTALRALLPPKERRGIVLVDPPFEERGELERMETAVGDMLERFATGTMLLWYPVKSDYTIGRFHARLAGQHGGKLLRVELNVGLPHTPGELTHAGLLILNPPYKLDENLRRLLPFLARRLALSTGSDWLVEQLGGQ